ncbi:hypothetical protein N7462_002368 [Penicillium macrosclerotiorum]|uniref:uncharacterized protein n=1 Tax=Penicillium macrosclerotiorum TaxID=303699 RepID=UPI00254905A4|nr:uncharacterized protein N7462_002368 [Penicillium macrosclerotiorum]KAJ5692945.1 hypothetical protein N7462_002368 [Penicillium macrosclerotiorum]
MPEGNRSTTTSAMATMGAVTPYGQLVRTAARTRVSCIPRRTLTSSAICRAPNDNDGANQKQSSGILSSMKDWVLGSSKPKVTRTPSAPKPQEGGLGASSIFADDVATPSGPKPSKQKKQIQDEQDQEPTSVLLEERERDNLQMALNPNPRAQIRWEKKMVIREIRKRGRIPKEVQIKRTERESLSKSHWFKTSVKKLGPLARQIAGKNIDEAILQMRFSKKKAAQDILGHLEHAKNVAMVRAGMGLPDPNGESPKPITVTLKSGERKKIADPTAIYIQQAWVNRGPYGFGMDHRARGQINRLRPPATGLTVLLKEEKTRIREWEDREAKELRKRKAQLWTQLPDRKVIAQNQYYSW